MWQPVLYGGYVPFASTPPVAECTACTRQSSVGPVGSGLPWNIDDNSRVCAGYEPGKHYAPHRLVF